MTEVLSTKTVAVAGCGGLGSNAAVALVRSGIGHLILADFDVVEASNLNRQYFDAADVGKKKVEALAAVLRAIRPDVKLTCHDRRLVASDVVPLFAGADLMIEAFDRAENKQWLIEAWTRGAGGKPIVCGNGLAGLGRTDELRVTRFGAQVYFCGDGKSDLSLGLCAARVAIAANMQANVAIELLVKGKLQ